MSSSALGKIGVDLVVKKTVDAINRDVGRHEASPSK